MDDDELLEELSKILNETTAVGRECNEKGHDKMDEMHHAITHADRATEMIKELQKRIRDEGVDAKYPIPRL